MNNYLLTLNIGAAVFLIGRIIWHNYQIQNQKSIERRNRALEEVNSKKNLANISNQASNERQEEVLEADTQGVENTLVPDDVKLCTEDSLELREEYIRPRTARSKHFTIKETYEKYIFSEKQIESSVDQPNSGVDASKHVTKEDSKEDKIGTKIENRKFNTEEMLPLELETVEKMNLESEPAHVDYKELGTDEKDSLVPVPGPVESKELEIDEKVRLELVPEQDSSPKFSDIGNVQIAKIRSEIDSLGTQNDEDHLHTFNELETVQEEDIENDPQTLDPMLSKELANVFEEGPPGIEKLEKKLAGFLSNHLTEDSMTHNDLGTIRFQFKLSDLKYPSFLELGTNEIKLIKDSYARQELEKRLLGKTRPPEICQGNEHVVPEQLTDGENNTESEDGDNESDWEDVEEDEGESEGEKSEEGKVKKGVKVEVSLPYELKDLTVRGKFMQADPSVKSYPTGNNSGSATSMESKSYADSY